MRIQLAHTYDDIISVENLLGAWEEFVLGKRSKRDVAEFAENLMDNIVSIHHDLTLMRYTHGRYIAFSISDPKPRNIHKATVRDRLLHRALYRILYPFFDRTFYTDSYSCRIDKGVHIGIRRFRELARRESKNHSRTIWVLKCDIRKFFASVDHKILMTILKKYISEAKLLRLIEVVIKSFNSGEIAKGLPLGNLTSQLLVNIYMNEFDIWVKHSMRVKHYIRYADDFVIISKDKDYLLELIPKIADFLKEYLNLTLHPHKISIKTFASGVDFLGWVNFVDHRILRTSTRRRVIKALVQDKNINTLKSYGALLKHGNQFKLRRKINTKIEKLEAN